MYNINFIELCNKFISCFILTISTFFMWSKLLNKKLNFKSYKLYISLIFVIVISIINYYNVNQYIRIVIITSLLMIVCKYVFSESLQKCVVLPILTQLITMISEMTFVFIVCVIFDMGSTGIIDTQFGQFFSNVIITIIALLIVHIPLVYKFYKFLLKITDKINKNQLIIFSFLIVIIANVSGMFLYYEIEFRYLLIFNVAITLFFLGIIIYSFNTKNKYMKVYDKYNTTLNSLKEYEKILDKYRISNHENKNDLLTIRSLIINNDKEAISYIDKIVKNKMKDHLEV